MSRLASRVALFFALAALCLAPAQIPLGSPIGAGTVPVQFATGAWPVYTPTTTHLTTVTSTAYGIQSGKTAFFSFWVQGTSDGNAPQISMPFNMFDSTATFSCNLHLAAWTSGIAEWASSSTVSFLKYDGSAPINADTYIFACNGTYQTP